MTRQEVSEKVRDVLVDALGVDEDEVMTSASIINDLGAESIDFMDIAFRLEKAFTTDHAHPFRIEKGDMIRDFSPLYDNPEYVVDGNLTSAGIEYLKRVGLDTGTAELEPGIGSRETTERLFTVGYIERYMWKRLGI